MSEKRTGINKIYCGDNLEIMRTFPDEFVDLIYLDPPFFSGRNYEVIWGDKAEVRLFEDRWEGGINHYVLWMVERLKEMHRILKPTGSIYLHCDWHASHYLKIEMDKIFGYNNFRNEIIWHYTGGLNAKKSYPRKHDVILFYSKTNNFIFNIQREPYTETSGYAKGGIVSAAGKKYMPNSEGKPIDDVWNIPIINPISKERLGYPTQKPEALLKRIINASSNKGELVCDPFCGCGTTVAVADRLKRHYIGIDISPIACGIIAKRVRYSEREIIGLPTTIDDLKKMKPYEFQQWVCDKMLAKNTSRSKDKPSGGDGGKDGVVLSNLNTGKYGGAPIQVKQSNDVGVNVVKNLFATMHDLKKKDGFIIALSFGSGAVEQVAKYKLEDSVNIKLILVENILKVPHYNFNIGYDFGEKDDVGWTDKTEPPTPKKDAPHHCKDASQQKTLTKHQKMLKDVCTDT